MAKPLFQIVYEELLAKHPAEFAAFSQAHTLYQQDKSPTHKTNFDQTGKPVVRFLEEAENRLCMKMENSSRGKYSSNLSDKFRAYVRSQYPLIDLVGVTIS